MLAIGLLLVAAVCQAESVVIVKRLPPGDPVAANAIGMLLGGALLDRGQPRLRRNARAAHPVRHVARRWPTSIGPGSIVVFVLALYVLAHWTASATSYGFLLFPLVAISTRSSAPRGARPAVVPARRGGRGGRRVRRRDLPPSGRGCGPGATELQPSPRRRRRARRRRGLAGLRRAGSSSRGRW